VVAVFDDAEERIAVVDFETGRVTARLDQRSIGVVAVNLSPDGALVAVSAADNAVRLFQAATGKKLNAFDPDPAFGGRPLAVFSPDGQKVYATGLSTGVARYAVGGRIAEAVYALPELPDDRPANRWRKPSPGDRVTCLAVGPDGTALALGTSQGEVRVFQVPTGRPTHDLRLPGRVTALAFSTDGRALAAATGDGAIHLFGAK
jgi:WD40 repeat protein